MIDTQGLALEQAPPFHLPVRFFLTAPLFALLAGLMLFWVGGELLASRWHPATLATTHLVVVGYLGQVMCGALLQMLPVMVGSRVPAVRWSGGLSHGLLVLGALGLAAGLGGGGADRLALGASAAGLGWLVLLVGFFIALARARGEPGTRRALSAAVLALALTLVLGLLLAANLLGWLRLEDFTRWVDTHVAWGLLGWVGLLILGVALQVIPLFFVTQPYPPLLRAWLVPMLLLILLLGSLAVILGWDELAGALLTLLVLGFVGFALLTLVILARRERRRQDPTLLHWWAALLALCGAALSWILAAPPTLTGVLLLAGVGLGLPAGMLFKITPFLAWFHLQQRQIDAGRFEVRLPHMGTLLPLGWARVQFGLHLGGLLLLVAAVFLPELARLAGLALAISNLVLEGLLVRVVLTYRRTAQLLGPVSPLDAYCG